MKREWRFINDICACWFWVETKPVEFGYAKKKCPECYGIGIVSFVSTTHYGTNDAKCLKCNGTGEV